MHLRHFFLVGILLPLQLFAQRTCSTKPVDGVYLACATDRPARLIETPRPFKYPEVLVAAGIVPGRDPVVTAVIDSTGRIVSSSMLLVPSPNHHFFRNAIGTLLESYRFAPALRDGHPVASIDSIRLKIGSPPPLLVPRDCVDCDDSLYAAQQRAIAAGIHNSRCVRAISVVMSWDIPDSLAWAFEIAPTCPGATDAAEVAARLAAYHYTNGIGPRHWVEFASRVHSRPAFEFAMNAARRGEQFAFTILAFQATGTSARIADSIPRGWEERSHRPKRWCGPLLVIARTDTMSHRAMDPGAIARAVMLADSLMTAPGIDPEVRASAWCLAALLR